MLVLGDSYDHYADVDKPTKWTQYANAALGGSIAVVAAIGARGTSGLRIKTDGNQSVSGQLCVVPDAPIPSGAKCGVAFRFKSVTPFNTLSTAIDPDYTAGAAGAANLFRFRKTSATIWWVKVNTNGTVSVYEGTNLRGTSSSALIQGTYQWIEFEVVLSATVGTILVKFDGITVINLTNQNTSAGVNTWDEFRLGCVGNGGSGPLVNEWHIDDFTMFDGSGAVWNTLQGDIAVDVILPDANGTTRDFTPSTGANDFSVTNEQLANGDVNYLVGAVVNDLVTMGYPTITSGLVIKAIQLVAQTKKTDAGTAGLKGATRIGGTDYLGTERGVATTYAFLRQIWELSPATGVAWTEAEVNAAEFGVEKST